VQSCQSFMKCARGIILGIIMSETREIRLKRLKIRSWRRGIKEMDLILGAYADECMASLSDSELNAHETLMDEQDLDLYSWITGQFDCPEELKKALKRVKAHYLEKNAQA